jgi:hypothetical protein
MVDSLEHVNADKRCVEVRCPECESVHHEIPSDGAAIDTPNQHRHPYASESADISNGSFSDDDHEPSTRGEQRRVDTLLPARSALAHCQQALISRSFRLVHRRRAHLHTCASRDTAASLCPTLRPMSTTALLSSQHPLPPPFFPARSSSSCMHILSLILCDPVRVSECCVPCPHGSRSSVASPGKVTAAAAAAAEVDGARRPRHTRTTISLVFCKGARRRRRRGGAAAAAACGSLRRWSIVATWQGERD